MNVVLHILNLQVVHHVLLLHENVIIVKVKVKQEVIVIIEAVLIVIVVVVMLVAIIIQIVININVNINIIIIATKKVALVVVVEVIIEDTAKKNLLVITAIHVLQVMHLLIDHLLDREEIVVVKIVLIIDEVHIAIIVIVTMHMVAAIINLEKEAMAIFQEVKENIHHQDMY